MLINQNQLRLTISSVREQSSTSRLRVSDPIWTETGDVRIAHWIWAMT
jgi:hypothetical protein